MIDTNEIKLGPEDQNWKLRIQAQTLPAKESTRKKTVLWSRIASVYSNTYELETEMHSHCSSLFTRRSD